MTAVCSGTGDVLVSDAAARSLSVLTADCAPVALGSGEGVFAAVHAGWRGLRDGVVEAAVAAMRTRGATRVVGALGPCIHPGCYEFAEDHLDDLVAHFGDRVRGRTSAGRPALDIPAAVSVALAAGGAEEVPGVDACTACSGAYFSYRARRGPWAARPCSCGRPAASDRPDRPDPPPFDAGGSTGAWRRSAGASARPRATRPRCRWWR